MVGYSLGGLWSRYAIGLLAEKGLLKVPGLSDGDLEPVLFTTFATPHLGTLFHGQRVHTGIINSLGSNMIGSSGRDLFLKGDSKDPRPVLQQMADPSSIYFKALASFKKRILYSNAANDRTVPFYTSFLVDKNPFEKRHHLHLVHRHRPSELGPDPGYDDQPKTIFAELDIAKSSYIGEKADAEEAPKSKWKREDFILAAVLSLSPLLIPIILVVSGVGSIASNIRVQNLNSKTIKDTAARVEHHPRQRRNSIGDNIAKMTGAAIDDLMNHEDGAESQEQADTSDGEGSVALKELAFTSTQLYVNDVPALPLAPVVLQMMENLNTLTWEKHVVLFQRRHSHAEIINRRNKPGQGLDIVRTWVNNAKDIINQ